MLPHVHAISATGFRKNMARWMRSAEEGAHVFLTRHGRSRCCLVSMRDAQVIFDLHGRSLEEYMHRQQVDYERWLMAKAKADEEWPGVSLGQGEWHYPSPALEVARSLWEARQRHKRHAEMVEAVEAERWSDDTSLD